MGGVRFKELTNFTKREGRKQEMSAATDAILRYYERHYGEKLDDDVRREMERQLIHGLPPSSAEIPDVRPNFPRYEVDSN